MQAEQFDSIARGLARGVSRREVVRRALAGAAGLTAVRFLGRSNAVAQTGPTGEVAHVSPEWELWLGTIDGSRSRKVIDAAVRGPAWSRDGQRLAYLRIVEAGAEEANQIEIAGADGSGIAVVVEPRPNPRAMEGETGPYRNVVINRVRWAPDDSALYYHYNYGNVSGKGIIRHDLATGEEQEIAYASDFNVAADGTIVFTAYYNGAPDVGMALSLIDLDGRQVDLRRPGETTGPVVAWSPDASLIAVGGNGLWVYDRQGGSERQLVDAQVTALTWSPDGAFIAFATDDPAANGVTTILTIPVAGGAPTERFPGTDPAWRPAVNQNPPIEFALQYFALGDSVASGHGLLDDGTPCHRSAEAYPYRVLDHLQATYGRVVFEHLACSGATAGEPEAPKDPFHWFRRQVDRVETRLKARAADLPALVSITIGVNDFDWLKPEIVTHLVEDADDFAGWVEKTTTEVAAELTEQVKRLLAFSNVGIVITQYHNPINHDSLIFRIADGVLGRTCLDLFEVRSCYDRTEDAIHGLNGALILQVSKSLGHPPRLKITPELHEAFHAGGGHEGPGLAGAIDFAPGVCGLAGPGTGQTWVQWPGDPDSNSGAHLAGVRNLPWTGDCFHPNVQGARAFADAVIERVPIVLEAVQNAGTAPKIVGEPAVEAEGDSAVITWTTDTPTSGSVEYGLTPDLGRTRPPTPGEPETSHRVELDNLQPGTTFYYRVRSSNDAGEVVSDVRTFVTGAPVPDLLVAYTHDFNVSLMQTDGGHKRVLTTIGTEPVFTTEGSYPWYDVATYDWSPDGRFLTIGQREHHADYSERIDLLVIDAATEETRTVLEDARGWDWSPSSRYLAVLRVDPGETYPYSPDVEVLDLQDGTSVLLGRNLSSGVAAIWAIDRDELLYIDRVFPESGIAVNPTKFECGRWNLDGTRESRVRFEVFASCGGAVMPPRDPAHIAYVEENGLYDSAAFPGFQWSSQLNIAFEQPGCRGGAYLVDLGTGAAAPFVYRALLSTAGQVAVIDGDESGAFVGITEPRANAPMLKIGPGEQPAWSADGATLYFVRRDLTNEFTLVEADTGQPNVISQYTSSIWRVNADGSGLERLVERDAYGFGPLRPTADDRALLFTSIDNATGLWEHRLAGDRYDRDLLARYPPQVRILGLDLETGKLKTLARDAHWPEIQPAPLGGGNPSS